MVTKQIVRKISMAAFALAILNVSNAQFLKNLQKKLIPGKTDTASTSSSLSNTDIVSGLKEALNTGTTKSANRLSAADGFLKDAAVKILLPPQVQKIEKTARMMGLGKVFDDAVTSMNRAAENAAKSAAPIFLTAIKNMSISDALGILKGGDTSATSYLRKSSTAQLTTAFRPSVDSSITKVGATKYWNSMATTYNKFSQTPMETDLTAYVTQKAIDGIFYYVAQEEKNIRKDPAAYASSIIQKVFGGK
jgi:hypothetical protein